MLAEVSQDIASDSQSAGDNREVYLRLEPTALALAKSDIVHVNVDCFQAASRALRTKDNVVGRKGMIDLLPEKARQELDFLGDCARALLYTHCLFKTAVAQDPALEQANLAGIEIRKCLLAGLKALIQRGVLGRSCLDSYTGRRGYHRVANDILPMVTTLRLNWDQVKDKCPFTEAELLVAENAALKLLQFTPGREQKRPLEVKAASDKRDRVFTLLLRSYASVRREVLYHCWDVPRVSSLVPSLYKASEDRKKTSKHGKEQQTTAEQEVSQELGVCEQPRAVIDSSAVNRQLLHTDVLVPCSLPERRDNPAPLHPCGLPHLCQGQERD